MTYMLILLLFSNTFVVNTAPNFPILNPGGIGGIFKGPDSETIIKGPDGSVITSTQEGGSIITENRLQPIIVAETLVDVAPTVLSDGILATGHIQTVQNQVDVAQTIDAASVIQTASAVPIIGPTNAIISEVPVGALVAEVPLAPALAPVVLSNEEPHQIDVELVDAPDVEPEQSATLIGPSGTITTSGSRSIVSGPASTTISEPVRKIPLGPVLTPLPTPLEVYPAAPIAEVAPILHQPLIATAAETDVAIASVPVPSASLLPPLAPLSNIGISSTIAPPVDISLSSVSSTLAPPLAVSWGSISSTSGTPLASTLGLQHNTIESIYSTVSPLDTIPSNVDLLNQINVQADPASAYGVINNANDVIGSTTLSPIISTTLQPSLPAVVPNAHQNLGGNIQNLLDQAILENSQLLLDPSRIPSSNIVPPEIGVQGARYLGSSFSVSESPNLQLASYSSNIQQISRNDNSNAVNVDGRLDMNLLTGEVLDSRNLINSDEGILNYANNNNDVVSGYPAAQGYAPIERETWKRDEGTLNYARYNNVDVVSGYAAAQGYAPIERETWKRENRRY